MRSRCHPRRFASFLVEQGTPCQMLVVRVFSVLPRTAQRVSVRQTGLAAALSPRQGPPIELRPRFPGGTGSSRGPPDAVLKTGSGESRSWVRIPPHPLFAFWGSSRVRPLALPQYRSRTRLAPAARALSPRPLLPRSIAPVFLLRSRRRLRSRAQDEA